MVIGALLSAGKYSRDQIVSMVDVFDAPPDHLKAIRSVIQQDSKAMWKFLELYGVQVGNGRSPLEAITDKLGVDAQARHISRAVAEIKSGATLLSADQLASLLEDKAKEIRERI